MKSDGTPDQQLLADLRSGTTNYPGSAPEPFSVTVDPTGKFAFTTHNHSYNGDSVSAYKINQETGALEKIDDYTAGVTPTSLTVARVRLQ